MRLALGSKDKYGVVTVRNRNGTLNRQYKITSDEIAALHKSGNGVPPGCTKAEWESGRAQVHGMEIDVGDVTIDAKGRLAVKFAEKTVNGALVDSILLLNPGEWTGELPNITVPQEVMAGIGLFDSLVNGELVLKV